jgi:methylglutaconyl-CoA hydratase
MPQPLVLLATDDPQVATLTLNRPDKRNALSVQLIEELRQAVVAAGRDSARRVLILRGAGPAFCAGLDLSEASDPTSNRRSAHALAALYQQICESPLVTIVAAQGAALGGGAGLLASCDLAIAADDLQIGFPEVRRGLVAALVTCLYRRQLGDRTLRELVLLGRSVDAARAQSLGLVTKVVAGDQLAQAAMELAREACLGAPGAVARTKRLLDRQGVRTIAEDLKLALEYHLEARDSTEAAEGMAAFREKRPPRWGTPPG